MIGVIIGAFIALCTVIGVIVVVISWVLGVLIFIEYCKFMIKEEGNE